MRHDKYSAAPRLWERAQIFVAALLAFALDGAWIALGLVMLPFAAAAKALEPVRVK